jgi:cysteine-rich repeat protein
MKMKPTRTAVTQVLSTGRRRVATPAASFISLPLVTLFSLFLVINATPTQAGPPFLLVYGVPSTDGAVDPSTFPQDAGGMPLIPPVPIPAGAQSVDIDLYFHNWAASPQVSTAPCQPDPVLAGADVAGYEVCGWHLLFVANNGLQILAFNEASSDVKYKLTDDPGGDSLNVTGGTPMAPPAGVAVPIGTVSVSVSDTDQTLESRPGGAQSIAFVSAALAPQVAPISIVASSLSTCGDGTIVGQPHEECDDSNTVSGDGCYRNCQVESDGSLEGTATAPGDVQIEIEAVNLVVPTVAGETAEQIITNVVDFVNTNSDLITLGVTAEQVDTPSERLVTDGSIGAFVSNTPGLVFVPEPSQWLMLATGVAFLAAVGRRRFAR